MRVEGRDGIKGTGRREVQSFKREEGLGYFNGGFPGVRLVLALMSTRAPTATNTTIAYYLNIL